MKDLNKNRPSVAKDVEAVITSFNQGSMILEAVRSLYEQTLLPARILLVDDGSTDENSIRILEQLESDLHFPVSIEILRQPNGGVSAARNAGGGLQRCDADGRCHASVSISGVLHEITGGFAQRLLLLQAMAEFFLAAESVHIRNGLPQGS